MKNTIGIVLFIALLIGTVGGYVKNIVSLCHCDFKPSYKAEVIRGLGVIIPPVGVIAGWIDINDGEDSKKTE